jgi:hypothetical protein
MELSMIIFTVTYAGIDTTVTVMNSVIIIKIGSKEQTAESELEH